jgi:outer membrane lipoprotein
MKMCLGKQMLALGLILVSLSGCVTYPIAKNLQQQAKPLTLSQVVADPDACQGTIVIWGGRIIKTVNDVNRSAVYVLELPLGSDGQPLTYANTSGRFIASSKGILDPEVYKRGELITVAGAIAGLESEPVQNTKYNYPVLDIKQTHLWTVERRDYDNGYYDYPYGYGYGYYPGWYWWGWYPAWGWGWWGRGWYGGWHYQNQGGNWHEAPQGGHWGGAYHYQGGGGGHWQGHH